MVQWLGLWASTAEDLGSVSNRGTLTRHAVPCGPPFPLENALRLKEKLILLFLLTPLSKVG